jgi:TrpR-related protein YerC/YecD
MAYQSKLQSKDIDDLFEAIQTLDNTEECYRFFEDLVTVKELQAMAQRWQVAKSLDKGLTYIEIEKQTGASAATISRINRCMAYGSDGYKRMIEKTKKQE